MGVDPTIFRRYLWEADEASEVAEDEVNETTGTMATTTDKRTEVNDYKMPRRKTTRRKKGRSQPIPYSEDTDE